MRYFIFLSIFFFSACAIRQPIVSRSATVVFKTPAMKFYDKGFITRYDDHIHLEVFSVGQLVLDLNIYEDKVCKSSLECMDAESFNTRYLHKSYKKSFLYELFNKENIYYKDNKNNILIKIK